MSYVRTEIGYLEVKWVEKWKLKGLLHNEEMHAYSRPTLRKVEPLITTSHGRIRTLVCESLVAANLASYGKQTFAL